MMTARKTKHLRTKLPIGPDTDYEKAYHEARSVIDEQNATIDWLNGLLDWTRPKLSDLARVSLTAMRNDPTKQMPPKDGSEKPARSAKIRPEDSQTPTAKVTSITGRPFNVAPLLENIPEATAAFLLDVQSNQTNPLLSENFEHMKILRGKGIFVLQGADNQLAVPTRLSSVGVALCNLIRDKRRNE
jgi:hypothetical protein